MVIKLGQSSAAAAAVVQSIKGHSRRQKRHTHKEEKTGPWPDGLFIHLIIERLPLPLLLLLLQS